MSLKTRPFAATTALEEFWDTSHPLVFFGASSRRYSRRAYWEAQKSLALDSPWSDASALAAAHDQAKSVGERILSGLASRLDEIHGEEHDSRYWRILIGPWLMVYVPVLYDRFCWVRHALSAYPDLTTMGLSPASHVVPQDTLDYVLRVRTDLYNVQIYSKVFSFLGVDFVSKPRQEAEDAPGPSASFSARAALSYAAKAAINAVSRTCGRVVMQEARFSSRETLRLALRTKGKALPYYPVDRPAPPRTPDQALRQRLADLDLGAGDFETFVSRALPGDLPAVFLEGYSELAKTSRRRGSRAPRAILSTNAWYFDEPFKRWAAISAEQGTKLLGCQHGGNYGSVLISPSEEHEITIADRFYSWGWESPGSPKVAPMPATLLCGVEQIGADDAKAAILYVNTCESRYLQTLSSTPERMSAYLDWGARFARALPDRLRSELIVRPHREDSGWDIRARWADVAPDLVLQGWDKPFSEALEECRLFVCDHLSTTYAQALALNKPCVLFWDPESGQNKLRPEAVPFHEALHAAGILHYDPETAAAAVAGAWPDVARWWNEPARQKARRVFRDRFARTSADAISRWAAELDAVAR